MKDDGVDRFVFDTESLTVTAPSIREAPARLECAVHRVVDLGSGEGSVKYVIGEVRCVVVEASLVLDGMWIDDMGLRPIGRLGGRAFLRTIPDAVYEEERIPAARSNGHWSAR